MAILTAKDYKLSCGAKLKVVFAREAKDYRQPKELNKRRVVMDINKAILFEASSLIRDELSDDLHIKRLGAKRNKSKNKKKGNDKTCIERLAEGVRDLGLLLVLGFKDSKDFFFKELAKNKGKHTTVLPSDSDYRD